MPTVSELAVDLSTEAGEATTDTSYLSLVRKWIKGGYREIGDASQWAFLKTEESINFSVAGGAEYRTQTSASEITAIRLTVTDEPVAYVPVERLIQLGYDLEQTGKPIYFYNTGYDEALAQHKFKVWPVPNATYAAHIVEHKMAKTLADADEIPMPANFLTILEDYVRGMQAFDDKDYEAFDRMERKWRGALAERLQRYSKQPARNIRLRVSDLPSTRGDLVPARLDPNHFSNYY